MKILSIKNQTIKILLIIFLFSSQSKAQSDFDNKLSALSDSIAEKINSKLKKKIAVWDFTDADGQESKLGKYLAEEISVDLTNDAKTFSMMDRNHLNTLLKEHKLKAEGFIDEATAKELGKISAVDGIVTGNVTVFGNKIKLTLKVLDTETALIIAAVKGDLPINDDVASFIGVPGMNTQNSNNANSNRGFNSPLNSNEQYNNPETVNKGCETNNTGDYCFTNNTSTKLNVNLSGNGYGKLSLEPGQTQCVYSKKAGSWRYYYDQEGNYSIKRNKGNGEILIEKCKSKTLIIR